MPLSRRLLSSASALVCALAIGPAWSAEVPAAVTAALHDAGRPPWEVKRDALRKPGAVLAFAGVKAGDVVADLVPDVGYYTRIFSAVVGVKGKVYSVVPDGGGPGTRGARNNQRSGAAPSAVPTNEAAVCSIGCYPTGEPPHPLPVDFVLAIQNIAEYKNVTVLWEELSSYGGDLALPDQADVVFSADGYHHIRRNKILHLVEGVTGRVNGAKPLNGPAFSKSVYQDLKPGGVYVVSDYAAAKGRGFDDADKLNRTDPEAVKGEILSAGFVLDGESNMLANPADDHSQKVTGTWADEDIADQYLLRFKKPASAPAIDKRPRGAAEAAIMDKYYGNTFIGRADLKALDTSNGHRTRFHYYNPDHTYEEFGRLGEGPGPMQAGVWFWDADGHNCQIHQFPLDERSNVVCHVDVQPDSKFRIGVMSDGLYGGTPAKVEIVRGHIMQDPHENY